MEVAPHAGAWIETVLILVIKILTIVAPHAGAWIETLFKHLLYEVLSVAPHAGAWIETPWTTATSPRRLTSRPTRARGLKLASSQHCPLQK